MEITEGLPGQRGFPGGSVVKNPPANAGQARDVGSIPGSGRSPRVGKSNPIQYSCLENSTDREAWWALIHGIAKSQTQPKQLRTHTSTIPDRVLGLGVLWQTGQTGSLFSSCRRRRQMGRNMVGRDGEVQIMSGNMGQWIKVQSSSEILTQALK